MTTSRWSSIPTASLTLIPTMLGCFLFLAGSLANAQPTTPNPSRSTAPDAEALPSPFPVIDWKVGDRVPNFRLPTLNKNSTTLTEAYFYDLLAGQPTILHIFASW